MESPIVANMPANPHSNLKWFIAIGILAFLLAIAVTWIILSETSDKKLPKDSTPAQTSTAGPDFFDSQTATVNGKVIKIEGDKLRIENQKGKTFDAKTYTAAAPQGIPAPVNTTFNAELNKPATITFQAVEGEYFITSIIYTQGPSASTAPVQTAPESSPSASAKPAQQNTPYPAYSPEASTAPLILERPLGT